MSGKLCGWPGVDRSLGRKAIPRKLFGEGVRSCLVDHAPIVDRTGRAGRDAVIAVVAQCGVDDVVARVVADRFARARLFAGVAANADFRVDEVLPQWLGPRYDCLHIHWLVEAN